MNVYDAPSPLAHTLVSTSSLHEHYMTPGGGKKGQNIMIISAEGGDRK